MEINIMLTIKDVAKKIGLTPMAIYKYIKDERIKSHFFGHQHFIEEKEYRKFKRFYEDKKRGQNGKRSSRKNKSD